jgi:hypothetical protein
LIITQIFLGPFKDFRYHPVHTEVKQTGDKEGGRREDPRGFGTVTGSFPYQQKGDTLYITDPSKGEYAFTIVDGKTIRTEVFGLAGTYRKR